MLANNRSGAPGVRLRKQAGVAAVEFALVAIIFLTFTFGVLEVIRAIYVMNTIQEVTRRAASAAATTDFRNNAEMSKVRRNAIFRSDSGELLLAPPITDQHVRIDYMALRKNDDGSMYLEAISTAQLPGCRAENRRICMTNPHDARCIQFVRARICDPGDGDACTAVNYKTIFPMVPFDLPLPKGVTITKAESLGSIVGEPGCP